MPDETGDENTSTAPMPAEDGNASERPNAGQHGDLYAESTDTVYVHDSVTGYWTGFERTDSEDLDEGELPDDAAPLHGITHNLYDVREIERLRATTKDLQGYAEGLEARIAGSLAAAERRAASWWEAAKMWCEAAIGHNKRADKFREERDTERETSGHHMRYAAMREAERDTERARADAAEAKLAEAEAVAAKTKAHYIRRCENLANVRDRIRGERDEALAKLAEVLAVLDSFDPNDWSSPAFAFEARRNFARIRKIVNPEAGQ